MLCEKDMLTPFMIPEQFNLNDTALTQGPFTNLIGIFDKISDERVQLWQQYLCRHAAPTELESNAWVVEIM